MTVLRAILAERFVPFLPPLLGTAKPEDQATKQLSRAFSAFALHKLLNITPKDAAASVVDDFNDKGLDAIHYHARTETLYLLQTKLKESEQFKQDEAQSFCTGIRLLLKQDFTGFNGNVQNRKAEIEGALDACSRIKLVVPYTGDGVSQSAIDALQVLLDDDDLDDERLDKRVDYYAAADITRDLLAEQAYPPVHTDIALQKYAKVENPRTTYYGIARVTDLVALHKDKGKALYERNIRYFLGGSRSDVNKAIKATLRHDPGSFFYLNNGVTAVCDEIELKGKNPAQWVPEVQGSRPVHHQRCADGRVRRRVRGPAPGQQHRQCQGDAHLDQGPGGWPVRQARHQSAQPPEPGADGELRLAGRKPGAAAAGDRASRLRLPLPPGSGGDRAPSYFTRRGTARARVAAGRSTLRRLAQKRTGAAGQSGIRRIPRRCSRLH